MQKYHYPPSTHHIGTSENVLFPDHNHLLTTNTDGSSLGGARVIIRDVSGHQYQWLAGGIDLEIGQFQKWLAWWLLDIMAFLRIGISSKNSHLKAYQR